MPSKTVKSNPVMESRISSFESSRRSPSWTLFSRFDGSRRSHSWTLVENEYATLLLGEEGKIIGGYFLDDIHPLFFHVGGSGGLSYGPIDFLGMIGGKTSWTAEDSLDLEYDCDLVGLGVLDHDHRHDRDDDDDDAAVVGLEGLEDGVDFLGFNNILGLSGTTIGYHFVFVNGQDYFSGFIQFVGKHRPTLTFVKGLEMMLTELIFRPLETKPINFGLQGKSGPVSIRTKIRLKASSVPRPLVSVEVEEAIRIPVLLSYSENDGDLELYVPTFDARVVRPPLAVNFSRYVMVSHNYRNCEFLLLNDRTREIIVYRLLDNTVVNLPYIQHFREDWFWISGSFLNVILGRGRSDYFVFVIAFHRDDRPVGTQLWLYYKRASGQVWNRRNYRVVQTIQRPQPILVTGTLLAWMDIVSGMVFTIGWTQGVPVLGPRFVIPGFAGAQWVLGVRDEGRTCVVVHHRHVFTVYDVSIHHVPLQVWSCDLRRRENLSNRNFYCSVSSKGFSAAPLRLGAGPINAILVGGYRGDCSRLNNYPEIMARRRAGSHVVRLDFECLRHCHDPVIAAHPLLCRCQSAFLLLPMHLVARMIPDLAPFLR